MYAPIKRFVLAMIAICGLATTTPALAGTVDQIKARGKLVIGAEVASPPYISRADGVIVGYEPDILAYMAQKLGVKLEIVDAAWSGILPSLIADKFDAVFSGMTVTKDRLSKVAFSKPYGEAAPGIIVFADSGIGSIKDMAGKRLGFAFGSSLTKMTEDYNAKLTAAGLQPIAVKTYDTPLDAFADLMNKRVDAAANKAITLQLLMNARPNAKLRVVRDMNDMVSTAFIVSAAVPQGNTSLLDFINATLDEMRANGKLAELQTKWFGGTIDIPAQIPPNTP